MKIAVRLDDITPDMDWERFLAVKKLLDRCKIKPLIGVIPDNRDENIKGKETGEHPEFWSYMQELKSEGWVIAMHGFQHRYTTQKGGCFPLNAFSEFAGLPYEKQRSMLQMGKEILSQKGIETEIFMAPAHSYDKNTLRALKETGFAGLTDGFGSAPYLWKGLTFYPISFQLGRTLRKKKGFSTMVLHAGTMTDEDLKRVENYFQMPGPEWISFSEYLKMAPKKRQLFARLWEFMLAKAKHLLVQIRR